MTFALRVLIGAIFNETLMFGAKTCKDGLHWFHDALHETLVSDLVRLDLAQLREQRLREDSAARGLVCLLALSTSSEQYMRPRAGVSESSGRVSGTAARFDTPNVLIELWRDNGPLVKLETSLQMRGGVLRPELARAGPGVTTVQYDGLALW